MMSRSEYTPTTEDALGGEIARVRHGQNVTASDLANRLMPWLAAHDAEVHAEWEAEQGETEWEYGLTWEPSVTGDDHDPQPYTGCETEAGAWETGRRLAGPAQTPSVWKRPMRPAIQAIPAGPWMPVPDTTGDESGGKA